MGVCSERLQKRGFGKRRQKKVSMSSPSSPSPSLRKPPLISRYPPFTAARSSLPCRTHQSTHPIFPAPSSFVPLPPKKGRGRRELFPRLLSTRILKVHPSLFSKPWSFFRSPFILSSSPLPSVLFMAFSDSRSRNSEIERGGGERGEGRKVLIRLLPPPSSSYPSLENKLFGKGRGSREGRKGRRGWSQFSVHLSLPS